MKKIIVAVLAAAFSTTMALAADTEGTISALDPTAMTITLDNGETYKLPAEMDTSAISEGVEVVIAYQQDNDGSKQITDLFVTE